MALSYGMEYYFHLSMIDTVPLPIPMLTLHQGTTRTTLIRSFVDYSTTIERVYITIPRSS